MVPKVGEEFQQLLSIKRTKPINFYLELEREKLNGIQLSY